MRYRNKIKNRSANILSIMLVFYTIFLILVAQHHANHSKAEHIEAASMSEVIYIEREIANEIAEEDILVEGSSRYASIAKNITQEEIELLAKLTYEEARGESILGQRAVVEVVLNRVIDERFPDTIKEVIYQTNPTQFTPAYKLISTTPTEEQYEAVYSVLNSTEPILPSRVVFFSQGTNGCTLYEKIGNHCFCY